MADDENRIHARLKISAKIEVATPSGRVEAELIDLSKGGARFIIAQSVGAVGDTIEVFLPSLGAHEISAQCAIIRSIEGDKGHTVAVRFDAVEPAMRDALLPIIDELLAMTGGGARAHPRVARRVDLRFGGLYDFQAILEDISTGGLQMTVEQPLVLYEELDVGVPDLGGGPLLTLRAQVVHQHAEPSPQGTRYRVGLEFIGMRPEARLCLEVLIKAVLDAEETPKG